MITVERHGPGSYTVTDTGLTGEYDEVTIVRNEQLTGPAKWIARAGWDRYNYTDPLFTLADAKTQATGMLAERAAGLVGDRC